MKFLEEFKLPKNFDQSAHQNVFGASLNDVWAIVNVSFSLPEWQAVKMIFFAPFPVMAFNTTELLR